MPLQSMPIAVEVEKEQSGFGLHNCPMFRVAIAPEQCVEQTRLLRRNKEKCCAVKCASAYRRCIRCVENGHWRTNDTIVIDAESGLCKHHLDEALSAPIPKLVPRAAAPQVPKIVAVSSVESAATMVEKQGDRFELIAVKIIRRNPEQPRQHFDPQALQDLAYSIGDVGQLQAIIVREVVGDDRFKFEIIEGERRWRACQVAKIAKIKAIVTRVDNADHQFEMSATANFSRQDHTELEEANAIERIMRTRGRNVTQVARAFGKGVQWVTVRLKLLKLDPTVQAFMSPTRGRNRLQAMVAAHLSDFPAELQIELAIQIVEKPMKTQQAMHLIRQRASAIAAQTGKKKVGRKPADALTVFERYLRNTGEGADRFLEASDRTLSDMYKFQSADRAAQDIELIGANIKRLQRMKDVLESMNRPA